jgi:hypothetical protein
VGCCCSSFPVHFWAGPSTIVAPSSLLRSLTVGTHMSACFFFPVP